MAWLAQNAKKLCAILLLFRVLNAMLVQTQHDPDENWQAGEVAHQLVFGYGILTWEWIYAVRSYMHVLPFAALFRMLKAVGLDTPDVIAHTPRLFQAAVLAGSDIALGVLTERHILAARYRQRWWHRPARPLPTHVALFDEMYAVPESKYVSFDDVLWARGVHLSRCFPRPLVDAAQQDLMHEVLASTEVDAPLRVVHGGSGPPKVIWAAPGALGSAHVSAATSASAPKAVTDSLETKAEDKHEDTLGSAEATHQNVGEGASGDVSGAGAGAGGADEADEVDAQVSRALQLEHEDETAAGNLGCMLPLFDMFEHKCGHPIVWEAGRGGVRFRCRAPVPKGAPLHNNYGAKGNEELLFTYGFAVRGNPLDAVEGVVVGCAPTPDTALAAERRRLLEEHGVPYTT
ncbi:gpi mannosyltransferase 3-like protein, partial [Chrysochromulina tobinii]